MAIASLIPQTVVYGLVALLSLIFGVQAVRAREEKEYPECRNPASGRSIFMATFLLLFVAEFGNKTQSAVVGLSSTSIPLAVWTGATTALSTASALGVWVGCTVLQRVPTVLLHRIIGTFFILLGLFAAYRTYLAF